MTALTMRDVYERLAPAFDLELRTVEYFARFLREANMLDSGIPGRHGRPPVATPESVASILIGLLGSATAVDAPLALRRYGTLRGSPLRPRVGDRGAGPKLPGGTFHTALSDLVGQLAVVPFLRLWRQRLHWVGVRASQDTHEAFIVHGEGSVTHEHSYCDSPIDRKSSVVYQQTIGAKQLIELGMSLRAN